MNATPNVIQYVLRCVCITFVQLALVWAMCNVNCGNMNPVGKILRLDNIDVISLLQRIQFFMHAWNQNTCVSICILNTCNVEWMGILQFETVSDFINFWTLYFSTLRSCIWLNITIRNCRSCAIFLPQFLHFFITNTLFVSIVGSMVETLSIKFDHVENFAVIVWIF